MIGEVYRLEQANATFYTLYDQDRYIIVEYSRGLTRYYVLASTKTNANNFENADDGAMALGGQGNHIYNLIHYVIPSVPESARVQQQVNKRSIDEDVKEFFAMKNLAHFTYENECFAQYISDVTQRTRANHFDEDISTNIVNRSFDDFEMRDDQKILTTGITKAIQNMKKMRAGALSPNLMDLDVSGETPQISLNLQHTNPHVGEIGSMDGSPPASPSNKPNKQQILAQKLDPELRVQNHIFAKKVVSGNLERGFDDQLDNDDD